MVVIVKYLGPGSFRGSRWSVRASDYPRREYPVDYSLNPTDNAEAAAARYAREVIGWPDARVLAVEYADPIRAFVAWVVKR